jgi:beta-lactamase regulating signal transducer with metallopeptidase domain
MGRVTASDGKYTERRVKDLQVANRSKNLWAFTLAFFIFFCAVALAGMVLTALSLVAVGVILIILGIVGALLLASVLYINM